MLLKESQRYTITVFINGHQTLHRARPQTIPADKRRWINVGLTLVHCLRRWTNAKRLQR